MAKSNSNQSPAPSDSDTIVANVKHPKKWPKRLAVVLLVLLLMGGASAGSWWYQKKQTDKAKQQAAEQATENAKLKQQLAAAQAGTADDADATADWASFTSSSAKLSFKYNPDWSSKSCTDNDVTSVFLAPAGTTQAVCNSEKGAMISVSSTPGDNRSVATTDYDAIGSAVVKSDVTVSGVAGKKVSYTADGDEFITAGTKLVVYEFFTGGRTYIATYVQAPGQPDVLADFNLLVNSTLQFS